MNDYIILAFSTPVLACLFWFIELLYTSGDNSSAKKHLAIFFFCGLISFNASFLFAYGLFQVYTASYSLIAFFYFGQISSFYIYLLYITGERITRVRYLKHYIIPMLATLYVSYWHYIHISPEESVNLFNNYYSPNNLPINQKESFIADVFLRGVFLLYTFFYMVLIRTKAIKHFRSAHNYFSNGTKSDLSWIRVANTLYALNIILGVIVFNPAIEKLVDNLMIVGIVPHLLLGFTFWFIGFKGNRQKKVFIPLKSDCNVNLPNDVRDNIVRKVIELMNEENFFLKTELTLPDLAKEVGTNRFYLSKIINEDFGMNFSNYINMHRVNYATELLKDNLIPIGDVARRSGFNSYMSFLRSFKKNKKKSPEKFRSHIAGS